MSGLVSSFERVKIGEFRYLFIIVTWNDYASGIAEEIEKQFEPFGADLGIKGQIVKAFKTASFNTADEVLSKKWTKEMKEKLESSQDPVMLIIDQDFNLFNPAEDQWAIIWFSDYFKNTEKIYRIFSLLSGKTKRDEDLFKFLKSQTKKENFKKWLGYIEISPGIFGFNIDGNKIFEELL
jgi:hypothetical protein